MLGLSVQARESLPQRDDLVLTGPELRANGMIMDGDPDAAETIGAALISGRLSAQS
jgi:hypothetical protein